MSDVGRHLPDGPVDPGATIQPPPAQAPDEQAPDDLDRTDIRRPRSWLVIGLAIAAVVLGGAGYATVRLTQDPANTVVGTEDVEATPGAAVADPLTTTPPVPGSTPSSDQSGSSPAGPSRDGQSGSPSGTRTQAGAAAGNASAGEQIDAYEVRVGDCLGNPGDAATVQTLTRLPCNQPHHSEAYASFRLNDAAYPGDEIVEVDAQRGCDERFTTFVGRPRAKSVLDFSFMTPTADTWKTGDREVTCLLYNPKAQSTTGSLQGSNL